MAELLEENDDILLMGNFSCKEVYWENWTTEGSESSWGNKLLDLAVENFLTQWVTDDTRFRENEAPSRLNLIFTKEQEIVEDLKCINPIGKSDHVLIQFTVMDNNLSIRKEDHRR